MNLNILKSFLVTSETKNLTKASELLNYSQSTVSTHIEKLERQLDVKLFYRKKYGMELTEEGLAYVKYAKVILDSNSEYEREIKGLYNKKVNISINMQESQYLYRYYNKISEWLAEHPYVNLKFKSAQSNISQRISKLENELGVVLLFRNQKGAKATKAGEEFLAYSKKVLRDTETIKNKMKNNTMSILCSELLFNYLSESEEIMMSNNSINFISSGNIRKAIEKNNYDKVISFIKINDSNYRLSNVDTMKVTLYSNGSNYDKEALLINKDEFCPLRKITLDNKLDSQRVMEIDSLAAIINLVKQGKGKALLPMTFENKRDIVQDISKIFEVNYYTYNHIMHH
ncbi:TPA: LysR family transcriptional regulator [Staphylococcus aureus]|nr:LysR family transcriptional regulator [Staphylococcus aureus]